MLFYHANVFDSKKGFRYGSFEVTEDRFGRVLEGTAAGTGTDLGGAYVIPGLVDIHTHGNSGADFSDGDEAGLRTMAAYLARHGVTSFAPASMTLPYEALDAAFQTAAALRRSRPAGCARIIGIHMEGPFLSETKKGAQNAAFLQAPDYEAFHRLFVNCGGLIRIVDAAPEIAGAAEFAARAAKLCTVSAAHTDAGYAEAKAFFAAGATHLTHLFNAMPSLLHRDPGVIGAASENEGVSAELICDGLHVHPSAVRAAFRLFPGRICLISDSIRCCGMPEGRYTLGGQELLFEGGAARLADGTIAGSAANLFDCLRNAIRFGIPIPDAVNAATLLPARAIGAEQDVGSIAPGKYADFAVCDARFRLQSVFLGGRPV